MLYSLSKNLKVLAALPALRRTNLEAQLTTILAERLGISAEEALDRYYSSPLAEQIEANECGLQYLDEAYLAEQIISDKAESPRQ